MIFPIKIVICTALIALGLAFPGLSMAQTGIFETKSVVSADFKKLSDTQAEIILTMQDKWHINAHQVTMEFLIPTEVTGGKAAVVYPQGKMIDTPLGQITVYDDQTVIPIELSPDDAELKLKAQACDGATCYPPSEWIFNTK